MKFFVFCALVAVAVAEVPPSNSYLPPPPGSSAGYPQGSQNPGFSSGPEVIAARSFNPIHTHGQSSGGFGRNNFRDQSAQARFDHPEQTYDHVAGRTAIEEAEEPANYNFGYMVNDFAEGTEFGHQEERQEEKAQGQYHVVLPDGRKQTVSYEADTQGFKPHVSYQDTEDLTRSNGYDSNANSYGTVDNFNNGDHVHAVGRSNGY